MNAASRTLWITMRAPTAIALTAMLLSACPSDSVDVPPQRPAGAITGAAVDGVILDGDVGVYSFDAGTRGARLGGGKTDSDGRYGIDIVAPSGPVLIEVTGGTYIEEASGKNVTLQDGQVLRSVAMYESGQPLQVTISPLTHVAAALAEYRVARGTTVATAVNDAIADVSAAFGVNVRDVLPNVITDARNVTTQMSDGHFYGFVLAGLSDWTRVASERNNVEAHTTYTSMAFAQTMYQDIRADGALDGRGVDRNGNPISLAVGSVPLDADIYRVSLAQHMMAMAASDQNRTGLDGDALRDRALRLAQDDSGVFGGEPSGFGDGTGPVVTGVDPEGQFYSGVFTFRVRVEGVVTRVDFDIDGAALGQAADPSQPEIRIDSRGYADGEHTIGVTASDGLGNDTRGEFLIRIDNTRPFVNVTSPLVTSEAEYQMTGAAQDNGAGIASITVNGTPVTLTAERSWALAVTLQPGVNRLVVVLTDNAGNRYESITEVRFDADPPVIDTGGRHGVARFVSGDDAFDEAPLADRNDTRPLYLMSDRLDLAGVPIKRDDLGASHIPFFAFRVSDPASNGAGSSVGALVVELQYEQNDQPRRAWRRLTAAESNNGYLIPIASEVLAPDWHQTTPEDRHGLRVRVTDAAGNVTERLFTFRADVRVPSLAMESVESVGDAFFDDFNFATRGDISGRTFAANAYTFTNTTGKSFYIMLSDDSIHQVDQLVETLVREHTARSVPSFEWRVRPVNNVEPDVAVAGDVTCPSQGDWEIVTALQNYNGSALETRTPPDGTPGEPMALTSDTLPDNQTLGDWIDAADFDAEYERVERNGLLYTLRYQRDYLLADGRPALMRNWQVTKTGSPNVRCADLRGFQQREVVRYESVTGPTNTSTEFHELSSFQTTDYVVIDTDATDSNNPQGTRIDPIQGWYRIPAGHTITLTKRVTAPSLTLYNDADVADPDRFASYTPRNLDKTVTWAVRPKVVITAVHDAGADRINSMASRDNVVAGDVAVTSYQISR